MKNLLDSSSGWKWMPIPLRNVRNHIRDLHDKAEDDNLR